MGGKQSKGGGSSSSTSFNESKSFSSGTSENWSTSKSRTTNESTSRNTSTSSSHSVGKSRNVGTSSTRSTGVNRSNTISKSRNQNFSHSNGRTHGYTRGFSASDTMSKGGSRSRSTNVTRSLSDTSGTSQAFNQSCTSGGSSTEGGSFAISRSKTVGGSKSITFTRNCQLVRPQVFHSLVRFVKNNENRNLNAWDFEKSIDLCQLANTVKKMSVINKRTIERDFEMERLEAEEAEKAAASGKKMTKKMKEEETEGEEDEEFDNEITKEETARKYLQTVARQAGGINTMKTALESIMTGRCGQHKPVILLVVDNEYLLSLLRLQLEWKAEVEETEIEYEVASDITIKELENNSVIETDPNLRQISFRFLPMFFNPNNKKSVDKLITNNLRFFQNVMSHMKCVRFDFRDCPNPEVSLNVIKHVLKEGSRLTKLELLRIPYIPYRELVPLFATSRIENLRIEFLGDRKMFEEVGHDEEGRVIWKPVNEWLEYLKAEKAGREHIKNEEDRRRLPYRNWCFHLVDKTTERIKRDVTPDYLRNGDRKIWENCYFNYYIIPPKNQKDEPRRERCKGGTANKVKLKFLGENKVLAFSSGFDTFPVSKLMESRRRDFWHQLEIRVVEKDFETHAFRVIMVAPDGRYVRFNPKTYKYMLDKEPQELIFDFIK